MRKYAHGLRGLLYVHEGKKPWRNVFHEDALDDPEWLAKLDVLIDKVKDHPAMYGYNLHDEPGTKEFPALAKMVALIREREKAYAEAIRLCREAMAQGWGGEWEKRIARCENRLAKLE